jgi:peptide deformylase
MAHSVSPGLTVYSSGALGASSFSGTPFWAVCCAVARRLHTVAQPVRVVDDRIRRLVADMLETMYDAQGIGLAATQVDVHERVVIDTSEDRNQPLVLVNPEIVWESPERQVNDEGCLSVPGIYDGVERASSMRVRALDEHGRAREVEAEGPAGRLRPARDGPPAGQGVRRVPVALETQPHQDQDAQASRTGPPGAA